ncbi:hypothetical protein E4T56_gene18261 [Termitomyces sp. T112]|nr:hypothetical protein E4T56_gene18261 [Termitomyces sp. T112]
MALGSIGAHHWHCLPAFPANGNNSHMYLREYATVPLNSTYFPPAHYYMYPAPLEHIDNYSPPCLLFSTQVPPSPRQQRVIAYAQQHNKVLHFLHPSSTEFVRCTHTLLINLGYPDTPATPKVWMDQLLNFHKCYLQGNLLETMQGTLAKPITFQLESSQVAFATFYLQGITFDHYTALLQFGLSNSVLSNWLAFTQEFSTTLPPPETSHTTWR